MPTTIQIRRGLDAAVAAVSGAAGEPLFTTDEHELWMCHGGGTDKTKIGPFDPTDVTLTTGTATDLTGYLTGDGATAGAVATIPAADISGLAAVATSGAYSDLSGTPTLGTVAALASDADTTLAANSDSRVATQKAVKAYVDASVVGLLDFKGSQDCGGNPNYPSALKGDAYYVSIAGKIGGAAGKSADVGDVVVASADNAGGTEASVGTSWFVLEHNLTGALVAANNLSDLASAAAARTNLGLAAVAASGSASDLSAGTLPAARMPALTGDVTTSAGAVAATIAANAVTNAKLRQSAGLSVVGRAGTVTGDVADITAASLYQILQIGVSGITWDGIVTGSIYANAVTDAKLRQSAGLSVVGRAANTTGDVADITAGTDGQVLRRSGTAVGFGAVSLSTAAAVTGTLPVGNGGTGQTSFTDGQLLIGNTTGNTLAKATLTAGSGVAVTNGGGSITVAIDAATQSDQESASSTAKVVTPGRQHYHPSAAKAWVTFSVSGGTVTVRASYNVSSIARSAAGNFMVNFTTAMSAAANNCPVASAGLSGSRLLTDLAAYSGFSTTAVQVITATAAGTLTDPDVCCVVVFGDQ